MNSPVKWVNTEPDAGAPAALLERLAQRVPPDSIEELWIFPTRRIAIGESTVFVVAARDPDDERRRVITARYAVNRNNKGVATVQEKIDEHGTAPAGAVARIVHGVLRRMGEEGEQQPRAERIDADLDRWWSLVEDLGGRRPGPVAEIAAQSADPAEPAAETASESADTAAPLTPQGEAAAAPIEDPSAAANGARPD